MRIPLIFIALSMLLPVSQAHAGRPLNTDDAATVAPGEPEIELSYDYTDEADTGHSFTAVITTGILDDLDVGIEIPYQYIDTKNGTDQDGFSDLGVTVKWNLLNDRSDLFDAAVSFSYKSDSGEENKGLGTGTNEYTVLGIITKNMDPFTVHLNLGPGIIESGDELLNYLVAGEWALTERFAMVGEVFGSNSFRGTFDDNPLSALLGITYQIKDNVVFDTGVAFGISDADPDLSVTTGVTIAL